MIPVFNFALFKVPFYFWYLTIKFIGGVELSTSTVTPATHISSEPPEEVLQRLENKISNLVHAYRESEKQRLQLAEEVAQLRKTIRDMQETSSQAEMLMGKLAESLTSDDLTAEELKNRLDQYIKKIDHALLFLNSQLLKSA
ncbi:MAG: hypothetical protein RMJ87_12785 [Cytophagales bacterium]|nr:hypothetical protein [Bernardetiaceae bacterium]MDW8205897.1 hypothetical protein [Cytophagales bacterium]